MLRCGAAREAHRLDILTAQRRVDLVELRALLRPLRVERVASQFQDCGLAHHHAFTTPFHCVVFPSSCSTLR